MELNKYQEQASRTLPKPGANHFFAPPFHYDKATQVVCAQEYHRHVDLLHALMGLTSEVGELADPIKKAMMYGKPLDVENIKEEAGDLLWYIAGPLCAALGCTLEELAAANADKLKKRYPEKYTDQAAIARADKV